MRLALITYWLRKAIAGLVALAVGACASLDEAPGPQQYAGGWRIPFEGSASRPVLSGGVLYVGSEDGAIYALDAKSGGIKWRFQTGEGLVSGTEIITVRPGAGLLEMIEAAESRGPRRGKREVDATPVVENGTVFIGSKDYSFYAIDAATGRKKWSFQTGGEIHENAVTHGAMVLFTSRDGFLYAVDANTGEKKWAFETRVPKSEPKAPIVADRVIYLAAGLYLYAIDVTSGLAKWSLFTGMSDFSQPTKTNSLIFVSKKQDTYAVERNRTTLLAVDASSGKVKWEIEAEGYPIGRRSSVIAVRDMVILGTARGLFAVDRETGAPRWNRVGGEGQYGPVYADESLVYFAFMKGSVVGGTDGVLYALDPVTGKDRWSFTPSRQIVAVLGDSICVAAKGYLYSVHKETGKELWKIDARVRTAATPLITSDTVFIPGMTQRYVGRAPHQGYFYAIDAKSGGL